MSQLLNSQGCVKTITIEEYENFNEPNDLKRIGSPYFNRANRWLPPINDISYEEFEKCKSFPAPIGIRQKDFCMPSQLLLIINHLVEELRAFIDEKLICQWCFCKLEYDKFDSIYKSKDNYMEICHKDPNGTFTIDNIYFGHGECNRRQGGYSEKDRINDTLILLKNNREKYKNEIQLFKEL